LKENLNVEDDPIGDVLRQFYRLYGIRGEGPSSDLNVSTFIANLPGGTPSNLDTDVQLLDRLIADAELQRLVRDCDNLLEDIANHSADVALLDEIDAHYEDMSLEPTAVFHGILWYAQAAQIDPRKNDSPRQDSPLESTIDSGASPLWALGQQVTGATILRLYVALVYLRGDWIRDAIGRASLDAAPSLLRYTRLLEHDIVRHLRNSLAHGHVTPTCAGLHVTDRNFEAVLSPAMLDKLCTWIFILHYSIFMVYAGREGVDAPEVDL